jgi:hypothetical protein
VKLASFARAQDYSWTDKSTVELGYEEQLNLKQVTKALFETVEKSLLKQEFGLPAMAGF